MAIKKYICKGCKAVQEFESGIEFPLCNQCDGELVELDTVSAGLITESFVLTGKAKEVFDLLEIKVKRAREATETLLERSGRPCYYEINTRCSKGWHESCIGCPVFEKIIGDVK